MSSWPAIPTSLPRPTPFGSDIKSRGYSAQKYRFGFNNQEKDGELGDAYAFEYRIHDARLGRFLSVDPLFREYLNQSCYVFAENKVVCGIDYEGLELFYTTSGEFLGKMGYSNDIKIINEDYINNLYIQNVNIQDYIDLNKLRELRIQKIKNDINSQNFFAYLILEQNSTLFHSASDKVASLILSDIYRRYFKSIKGEKIKAESLDFAFADTDNSTNEMRVDISSIFGVNVEDDKYKNEHPFDNLYNLLSTITHEREHLKGFRSDGFDHFKILKHTYKSTYFSSSTNGYKSHTKYLFNNYLAQQESFLTDKLNEFKSGTCKYGKDQLNSFIKEYKSNNAWYNNTYSENRKAENYEEIK